MNDFGSLTCFRSCACRQSMSRSDPYQSCMLPTAVSSSFARFYVILCFGPQMHDLSSWTLHAIASSGRRRCCFGARRRRPGTWLWSFAARITEAAIVCARAPTTVSVASEVLGRAADDIVHLCRLTTMLPSCVCLTSVH